MHRPALPPARGFSLLIVLLVTVVVALVGLTVLGTATTDEGAASARQQRTQAVVAAETVLGIYAGIAAPTVDCSAAPGTTLLDAELPPLETDRNAGADLLPRGTIAVGAQDPAIDGCHVSAEGQVRDAAGAVLGRALLDATVRQRKQQYGYAGQKDYNPQGTGSDTTGRLGYHTDI